MVIRRSRQEHKVQTFVFAPNFITVHNWTDTRPEYRHDLLRFDGTYPQHPPRRMNYANQEVCGFGDDTTARDSGSKRCSQGCGPAFWDLEDEPCQVEVQPRASTEEYDGKYQL